MNHDPLVEEIHEIRGRLLAECNGDLDQLLDRYKRSEDRDRVVTLEEVNERRQLANRRRTAE
jgi:hypothetical protein